MNFEMDSIHQCSMTELAMAGGANSRRRELRRMVGPPDRKRQVSSTLVCYGVTCLAMCDCNCTKLRNDKMHRRRSGRDASARLTKGEMSTSLNR